MGKKMTEPILCIDCGEKENIQRVYDSFCKEREKLGPAASLTEEQLGLSVKKVGENLILYGIMFLDHGMRLIFTDHDNIVNLKKMIEKTVSPNVEIQVGSLAESIANRISTRMIYSFPNIEKENPDYDAVMEAETYRLCRAVTIRQKFYMEHLR